MGCTFASLAAFGAASANGDLFKPRRSDEAAAQWIRACNENASCRGAPLFIISDFLSFYLVPFCFLVFSFVLRICAISRSLQPIQLLD